MIVMDRGRIGLVALVVLSLAGCAQETKVTRVDSGVVTDLSGRWNDTDSRMVAESMVKEALEYPWLNGFSGSKHRQPVVVVGTIRNSSHEHINVNTFVADLERELTNSQKVTFVAGREIARNFAPSAKSKRCTRERKRRSAGKEIGADYMMRVPLRRSSTRPTGRRRCLPVDLQMVDLESNAKVWYGQKKIKKVVEKKRSIF